MPLFCSTDLNKTGKTYWDKVELYYNSLLLIFLSESFPRCPCLDSLAAHSAQRRHGSGNGRRRKRTTHKAKWGQHGSAAVSPPMNYSLSWLTPQFHACMLPLAKFAWLVAYALVNKQRKVTTAKVSFDVFLYPITYS